MTASITSLPRWFKTRAPGGANYEDLKKRLVRQKLHTVCEEAACPNIGDCWDRRTATFMILGNVCTRACSYCNVKTGWPDSLDVSEPFRLADTIREMGLRYAVITSVDRDDLPDGGASIFAMTIRAVHDKSPNCKVEVLIPDFNCEEQSIFKVLAAHPDVLNHNIETVRRVFKKVRPKGDYQSSLNLFSKVERIDPRIARKSGIMVGLGETKDEIKSTMDDLLMAGCQLLTIGQYLRPSKRHHPVVRYYLPDEFLELKEEGMGKGFKHVVSGPLVRSSYHADEQHAAAAI